MIVNSASSVWSANHAMFEVTKPGKLTLRLRCDSKAVKTDSPAKVILRRLKLEPFAYRPGVNLLDNEGGMSGPANGFPDNWTCGYGLPMDKRLCGLSGEDPFQKQSQAMLIGVKPGRKNVILRGVQHVFPKAGVIEFSAWIRAVKPDSEITLNLWGDKHKWQTFKKFAPTSQWKQYTVKLTVPQQIHVQPDFWPGITVKSGQIAIGKARLTYQNPQSFTDRGFLPDLGKSRNLITNPDFELGYWGWMEFARSGRVRFPSPENWQAFINQPRPEIVRETSGNHALKLYPEPSLISFLFPLTFGKRYTVSLYLKSAEPGQNGVCKLKLLDQRWKYKSRQFSFTDQWRRYSFTFTNDLRSKLSSFYLRFQSCSGLL
jgi:hypothetical protein